MNTSIHFNIRTDRPKKDGSVPVVLYFTLNRNQRLKISLGKYISLKHDAKENAINQPSENSTNKELLYCWDSQKERATRGTENWQQINIFLDSEKARANKIIMNYELMNKPLTLSLFKKAFSKPDGIKDFREYFVNEIKNRRKHLIAHDTYRAYMSAINKVCSFKPDLMLADIDYKFLSEFENHMLKPIFDGGLGNIPNTVCKTMKMLRALILIAIKNDDFLKEAYPFKDYKIKHVDPVLTTRDYLEPEDLLKVEQLLSPEKIGDLSEGEIKATKRFLFACYTGLRFSDVNSLSRSNHIFGKFIQNPNTKEMVYRYYIELKMSKTDHSVFIPLIDKALELINETKNDQVFDKISNQKINKHLKSINKKAGLNKKLSFHVARHSFATICFLYSIPEKVGQKLLGHKNRKFTEVYTHLSQNKLFYEMDKLNKGLSQYELVIEDTDKQKSEIKEIIPFLQNLTADKLDQLKGLIKMLGS